MNIVKKPKKHKHKKSSKKEEVERIINVEDVEDMDISVDDVDDSPSQGLKLKIKIPESSPEKPWVKNYYSFCVLQDILYIIVVMVTACLFLVLSVGSFLYCISTRVH